MLAFRFRDTATQNPRGRASQPGSEAAAFRARREMCGRDAAGRAQSPARRLGIMRTSRDPLVREAKSYGRICGSNVDPDEYISAPVSHLGEAYVEIVRGDLSAIG